MVKIDLPNNRYAIIDKEDLHLIQGYKWTWTGKYVRATTKTGGVYLHRIITGASKGSDVDHKNGDTLDNRRENLRVCSRSENSANQKRMRGGSSKYKGVTFCKTRNKWVAKIMKNYKTVFIGRYKTEENAALAYNKKAVELFGEFAFINEVRL